MSALCQNRTFGCLENATYYSIVSRAVVVAVTILSRLRGIKFENGNRGRIDRILGCCSLSWVTRRGPNPKADCVHP